MSNFTSDEVNRHVADYLEITKGDKAFKLKDFKSLDRSVAIGG